MQLKTLTSQRLKKKRYFDHFEVDCFVSVTLCATPLFENTLYPLQKAHIKTRDAPIKLLLKHLPIRIIP